MSVFVCNLAVIIFIPHAFIYLVTPNNDVV